MRQPEREQYEAALNAADRRALLRQFDVAYDETDADGVRYVWHPEAVEEVEADLAAKAQRRDHAPGPTSYGPVASGPTTRAHHGPDAWYGDND